MYDYDYEADILLCLRVLKYLYDHDSVAVQDIMERYTVLSPDTMYEIGETAIWEILDIVASEDDANYDTTILTVSQPLFDRLYTLGRRTELARGRYISGWVQKIHDILEYFVLGASYSLYSLEVRTVNSRIEIRMGLSPDCYEPLLFGSSIVDALLYCQREIRRLETEAHEAEEHRDEVEKEAA